MSDSWTGEGYDAEASSGGGGLWLRLKKKGDKVRLRLVSIPYRWIEKYTDGGKEIEAKKVAWLAIHKELINGQPHKSVVIFSSTAMVYGEIRRLAESDDWGNPQEFDITVERTEESPAKYYAVTAIPKGMGPLSEEDRQLVAAANIDWPNVCVQAIQKQAEKDGPANGAPAHTDREAPEEEEDPFA